MRLKVEERSGLIIDTSDARLDLFKTMKSPKTRQDLINMLGDVSNENLPVFHSLEKDPLVTIAVGIFDLIAKTWTIYSDNPKTTDPILVLPLVLKEG